MRRFSLYPRGRLLWTSKRNSASWHGLRHSAHDCCNSQGEDQRAHRQHLHCGVKRLRFWSLPAFLLRHIWLCQLDSGVHVVAVWSFVFHGLWLGASAVVSSILESHDRQIRGWARQMSVGAMNSVLYPLLLRHPGFGERPTWVRPSRVPRHPLSRVKLHCHDTLGTRWDVIGDRLLLLLQPLRHMGEAPNGRIRTSSRIWSSRYDALSSSTCGACCNLFGRSRISCSSTCRDIRGSACCDLLRSLWRYLFAATTSGSSGHVHGSSSDCSCAFFYVLDRAASSPAVTFMSEAVKVAVALAVTYF